MRFPAYALVTAYAYTRLAGKPSTIDWCEGNHEVTGWVNEFWNCASMLPWIFSSMYGLYLSHTRGASKFASTAFFLSLWVALGSYYFHAELTRFSQSMDELPMMFLGLHAAELLETLSGMGIFRPLSDYAGSISIVGCSLITYAYCESSQYESFVIPYGIVTGATVLLLLRRIVNTANVVNRRIGLVGVFSMAFGVGVWAIEQAECRDWLKLHAVWHVFVGIATYALISFIAIEIGPGNDRVSTSVYFPASWGDLGTQNYTVKSPRRSGRVRTPKKKYSE